MSLYLCPRCKAQISTGAQKCPECYLKLPTWEVTCPDCGNTIWLSRHMESETFVPLDRGVWEGECSNCGRAIKSADFGCTGCLIVIIVVLCLCALGSCSAIF